MKTAITGRGVTLHMLINDGIIEPGNGLLTLKYLVSSTVIIIIGNPRSDTVCTKNH